MLESTPFKRPEWLLCLSCCSVATSSGRVMLCQDMPGRQVLPGGTSEAYGQSCLAGQNTPPKLQASAVNPGVKYLLLTAVDEAGLLDLAWQFSV